MPHIGEGAVKNTSYGVTCARKLLRQVPKYRGTTGAVVWVFAHHERVPRLSHLCERACAGHLRREKLEHLAHRLVGRRLALGSARLAVAHKRSRRARAPATHTHTHTHTHIHTHTHTPARTHTKAHARAHHKQMRS
eukprot:1856575-Pleurochrysis_carterae.AAC.3